MAYLLLRADSANVSASYATKDEALAALRAGFDQHGPAHLADVALAESAPDGGITILAEGEALLALVRATDG